MLPKTIANCIFGDHTMIAVEQGSLKGFRHSTVKEYEIADNRDHGLHPNGKVVYEMQTKASAEPGKTTQIRVVAEDEQIFVVVCNPDLTIEIVSVSPTS